MKVFIRQFFKFAREKVDPAFDKEIFLANKLFKAEEYLNPNYTAFKGFFHPSYNHICKEWGFLMKIYLFKILIKLLFSGDMKGNMKNSNCQDSKVSKSPYFTTQNAESKHFFVNLKISN